MKNCPNCGQEVQDEEKFCEHCGEKLEGAETVSAEASATGAETSAAAAVSYTHLDVYKRQPDRLLP